MNNILLDIIKNRNSRLKGVYSACTANELVIEAVMQRAKETSTPALIEATANQVNRFGGYTGMTPTDFAKFVLNIAKKVNLPLNLLILGGDHLGPLLWKNSDEEEAMTYSDELIKQYVMAGFAKIHIDTSMRLKCDDKNKRLPDEIIAKRAIRLIKTAEQSFKELLKTKSDAVKPLYVIGSEVPIPGGAMEDDGIQVTSVDDFEGTYNTFKNRFVSEGLNEAWERVIAIVVQPGVEFSDTTVNEYDRYAAKELTSALKKHKDIVFEGHSTDYQTRYKLKEMVEDGIAILKVGPALTFALREALISLTLIEKELLDETKQSKFDTALENAMLKNPAYWEKHYTGDDIALKFKRKYSFSDRARYYLPEAEVQEAIKKLIKNLDNIKIPLSMLSQYMPLQYIKVREGTLELKAKELILDRVKNCIDDYLFAII